MPEVIAIVLVLSILGLILPAIVILGERSLQIESEADKKRLGSKATPVGLTETRLFFYNLGKDRRVIPSGFEDEISQELNRARIIDKAKLSPAQIAAQASAGNGRTNFANKLIERISSAYAEDQANPDADDVPMFPWSQMSTDSVDVPKMIRKQFENVDSSALIERCMSAADTDHGKEWGHRALVAAEDRARLLNSYFAGVTDGTLEMIESRLSLERAKEDSLNWAGSRQRDHSRQQLRALETPEMFSRAMKQLENNGG